MLLRHCQVVPAVCGHAAEVVYDKKVVKRQFTMGTVHGKWNMGTVHHTIHHGLVFLPRRYVGRSPKWSKTYIGPLLVVGVVSGTNVRIQRHHRSRPIIVHVDKPKPCRGATPTSWLERAEEQPRTTAAETGQTTATRKIDVPTTLVSTRNVVKAEIAQCPEDECRYFHSSTNFDFRSATSTAVGERTP